MAVSLDFINKMPAYQRGLILLGLVVLIGVGYYFGIYAGKKQELAEEIKKRDKAKQELAKLEQKKKNLQKYKKKVAELEAELSLLLVAIPTDQEIPEILSNISSKGKESGLDFLLFQPRNEKKIEKQQYFEVPVAIKVTGTYHSFAVFLDKIRQLDRIINIRNITMKRKRASGGSVLLEISCNAVTFRFPVEKKPKKKTE
jgi:type IV pilus assembly protein PilO